MFLFNFPFYGFMFCSQFYFILCTYFWKKSFESFVHAIQLLKLLESLDVFSHLWKPFHLSSLNSYYFADLCKLLDYEVLIVQVQSL